MRRKREIESLKLGEFGKNKKMKLRECVRGEMRWRKGAEWD
jgi:hypothetical protein